VTDELLLDQFPGATPYAELFLHLVDGIGIYDLVIEIYDLRDDRTVFRFTAMEITFAHRLAGLNLIVPMPPVTLTHPGSYDVVVLANEREVERKKFTARRKDENNEPQEEERS
jgi:hypothetical protein